MTTATIQTETIQEKPLAAKIYVKLRKLTAKDDEPIEDILHRATEQLRGLKEKATIQLRLIRVGESARCVHSIQLTPESAFLQAESITKPTLVVITTSDSLRRIAEGSYSPVQAYLDGRVHLQGDIDLAKRVIVHLADAQISVSDVSVCPFLDSPRWQPDEPDDALGSLTLTGLNFTPRGFVDIRYDFGGDRYKDTVQADSRGRFTVTQPNIPCGGSVKVDALDHVSLQRTSDVEPTPCS